MELRLVMSYKYAIFATRDEDYNQLNFDRTFKRIQHIFLENIDQYEGCIIMSQLTDEEQNNILNYNVDRFYFFIGVRLSDKLNKAAKRFSTQTELFDQIKRTEAKKLLDLKKQYLEKIPVFTDDDASDLKLLCSNNDVITKKNNINRYFHRMSRRIESKKNKRKLLDKNRIKGIYVIAGHGQIASDFSKYISAVQKQKTILIDGDFLYPSLDIYLKINNLETNMQSHLTGVDNTGINIFLDALQKSIPIQGMLNQIVNRQTPYLDVLLGNYNIYNYEHYSEETLSRLILSLKQYYEIIIIHTGLNIYDEMTLLAMNLSDVNLLINTDEILSLRTMAVIKELLEEKQKISEKKNKFVFLKSEKGESTAVIRALFNNNGLHISQKKFTRKFGKKMAKAIMET